MDSQDWMELLEHDAFELQDRCLIHVTSYTRGEFYAGVYFDDFVLALSYYKKMIEVTATDIVSFFVIVVCGDAEPIQLLNRSGFALSSRCLFEWRKDD